MTVVDLQHEGADGPKPMDLRASADARPWFARRRMFGSLADLARDDGRREAAAAYRLLDARQRLDMTAYRRAREQVPAEWSWSQQELDRLAPEWEGKLTWSALTESFLDRLARREMHATMMGRQWLDTLTKRLDGWDAVEARAHAIKREGSQDLRGTSPSATVCVQPASWPSPESAPKPSRRC